MQNDIEMSSCIPHRRVPLETNRPQGLSQSIPVDPVLRQHARIHPECGLSLFMVCVSVTLSGKLIEADQ